MNKLILVAVVALLGALNWVTYDSLRSCKATNTALNIENQSLFDGLNEKAVSTIDFINDTNDNALAFDELISRIEYMRCTTSTTTRPTTTPSVKPMQIDTPIVYSPPDVNRHLIETLHEAFDLASSKP